MLSELIQKQESVLQHSISKLQADLNLLNDFDDVFFATFGERIKLCCGNTLAAYYNRLSMFYKNNTTMQNDKKKFVLNGDLVLFHKHETYTNENITDDVAIALIKEDNRRIANFQKFPENWEELVNGKAKTKAVKK